jgi:hypothetical protein
LIELYTAAIPEVGRDGRNRYRGVQYKFARRGYSRPDSRNPKAFSRDGVKNSTSLTFTTSYHFRHFCGRNVSLALRQETMDNNHPFEKLSSKSQPRLPVRKRSGVQLNVLTHEPSRSWFALVRWSSVKGKA